MALDISKSGTGLAAGDGSCPPVSSVHAMGGSTRGETGRLFNRWMRDMIVAHKPQMLAIEKPLVRVSRGNSENVMRLLVGLAFDAERIAADHTITYREVASATWRVAFLGKGPHPDAKRKAIRMCSLLQWPHGDDHNRAEAMGIWVWAHLHFGNRNGALGMLSHATMSGLAYG